MSHLLGDYEERHGDQVVTDVDRMELDCRRGLATIGSISLREKFEQIMLSELEELRNYLSAQPDANRNSSILSSKRKIYDAWLTEASHSISPESGVNALQMLEGVYRELFLHPLPREQPNNVAEILGSPKHEARDPLSTGTSFDSSMSYSTIGSGHHPPRDPVQARATRVIKSYFPAVDWIPNYDRKKLQGDVIAGITLGFFIIPQAMAYAGIAGLDPVYGLYATFVPGFIYAVFGSSRHLSVGPVSIVSFIVEQGVTEAMAGDKDLKIPLTITLSMMVGLIEIVVGVFRLGVFANLLSHPIITGFTSAAALMVIFHQLKNLFGLQVERSWHALVMMWDVFNAFPTLQFWPALLGVGSVILLVLLKKWKKSFPGALLVIALGGFIVQVSDMEKEIPIVGHIPQGLPVPSLPMGVSWSMIGKLAPTAAQIVILGYLEAISVAKRFASLNRYEIDPNQEFIALGMTNTVSSMFLSYPVTGSFSRTAVNNDAGAHTQMAGFISSIVVGLALLFMTPLFEYVPGTVLSAIIIVALAGLIDIEEVRFLNRIGAKRDLAMLFLAFFGTLILGVEIGIISAWGISLLITIYSSSRPPTSVLGRVPGTEEYACLQKNKMAISADGVVIFRLEAPLLFTNAAHVKDRVCKIVKAGQKGKQTRMAPSAVNVFVFDASAVYDVDSSGVHIILEIIHELEARDITLAFAGMRRGARRRLQNTGIEEKVGSNFFPSVKSAVHNFVHRDKLATVDVGHHL